MYRIIGADQKEYGPISADQVRVWIAEGRANQNTQARLEGATAWQPLSAFSEFAMALGIASTPPLFSAGPQPSVAAPMEHVLNRDYVLDIGACFGNGWNLVANNFGSILPPFLIYLGIQFGFAVVGMIPLIGPLFSLLNLLIIGALEGGLFYVLLRAIRRQPVNAGDVFEGFRSNFLQLFLGKLVTSLLAGFCMIPAVIVMLVVFIIPAIAHQHGSSPLPPPQPVQVIITVAAFLLCLIPVMVLQTNWIFTLPLIIDRKMDFWPAMQASWKMVMKHWWQVFAIVILVALLNIAGTVLCCVGLLFTIPMGLGALMYAYETIFSTPSQPTH